MTGISALVGAIVWNVVTWWYGIPSSSSHALVGGIVGAVIAKTGAGSLIGAGVWKTVLFIFLSPLLGFFFGAVDDGLGFSLGALPGFFPGLLCPGVGLAGNFFYVTA